MSLGRIFRPVVNADKCQACSVCTHGCPAEFFPELREEEGSLRGALYGSGAVAPSSADDAAPPCVKACPLGQRVCDYVGFLADGKWDEALLTIRRDNPLPSVCGVLCNHACQSECLRGKAVGEGGEPVAIRRLKLFATGYERENPARILGTLQGWKKPAGEYRVAVVGAGPAGLTAAYELAMEGVNVTVIEGSGKPGGMLGQAIPEFRFPREILEHEVSMLHGLGIAFELNSPVKDAAALEKLKCEYDAVLLALGAAKGTVLDVVGWGGPSCHEALSFLSSFNGGEVPRLEGPVVVVGGGNVAMDAARAAKRAGAERVTIAYRRGRTEMPVDPLEYAEAAEEGVEIAFYLKPAEVVRDGSGVTALRCFETEAGVKDASGRPAVVVTGRERVLPAQSVIAGVGQESDLDLLPASALGADRRVSLDETGMVAGMKGVFGAGDWVTGPSFVVTAMASGRKSARNILTYLEKENA